MSDAEDAHIVVTNIHQLAEANAERWLANFPEDFFDLILVDEGHHNAAPSWQNVFARFPRARVLSLTATPFRADEQPIEGETIYRYTFRAAMQRGYIKQMASRNVAPSELRFTWQGSDYAHTLDEVLEMREEDWYSRGVWLEAGDEPPTERDGDGRRRLRPDMVVTEEFIDRFLSDEFLDASDDALIDNALTVLRERA